MRLALGFAAAFAVALVGFDAALDSCGPCEGSGTETTSCHACACEPRLVTDGAAFVAPLEAPRLVSPRQEPVRAFLLTERIFHPPKLSA
jgi:hypothetical protein